VPLFSLALEMAWPGLVTFQGDAPDLQPSSQPDSKNANDSEYRLSGYDNRMTGLAKCAAMSQPTSLNRGISRRPLRNKYLSLHSHIIVVSTHGRPPVGVIAFPPYIFLIFILDCVALSSATFPAASCACDTYHQYGRANSSGPRNHNRHVCMYTRYPD